MNYIFHIDRYDNGRPKYAIDCTKVGNEARFINHSCRPNLSLRLITNRTLEQKPEVMYIAFFANRPILLGEELAFDYTGTCDPIGPNILGK
ncbi:hypothetical protein BGX33_009060 [Mortierella sp. NVP41]|nr:hypothetical protein BGX33_009060 [Mortierella sp. NVP41]